MRRIKELTRKRTLVAVVLALTLFGAIYGFAASLNVSANELSAGNASVASCQTSGTPTGTYTIAYDPSVPGYKVSGVTVTGMDAACDGKTIAVTLTGAANASLASGSAVYNAAGANTQVNVSSLVGTPSASSVIGVSVAVNG